MSNNNDNCEENVFFSLDDTEIDTNTDTDNNYYLNLINYF